MCVVIANAKSNTIMCCAATVIAISERAELPKSRKLTGISVDNLRAKVDMLPSVLLTYPEWAAHLFLLLQRTRTVIDVMQQHQRNGQACESCEKACISIARALQDSLSR